MFQTNPLEMPPKRKAALANKAVSAQKRSRATAVEGPVPTTSSTAVPENDVSSNAIELLPTQLQHLVKEAYQKGLEEGRQAISTPASRETVDVNSQALPLSSTVTNDIPTTSPSVTIDSISTAAPPCSASLATHNFIGVSNVSGVAMASTLQVTPSEPMPSNSFSSSSIPLGSLVNEKLKEKIWNDEFVDLSTLNNQDPMKYEMVVQNGSEASPVVYWAPKNKTSSLTIDQWTNAFHVFIAVYTQRKPGDFSALLQYLSVVRKLHSKQGDWQFYDKSFRLLKAHNKSMSWGTIEWELWQDAITRRPKTSSSTAQLPKGSCWRFITGKPCNGCRFPHRCPKCQGPHPPSNCPGMFHQNHPSTQVRPPGQPQQFRPFRPPHYQFRSPNATPGFRGYRHPRHSF
ncbi:uncharacterized protein [Argopecten irradians]|uniref:uncharacterized protein isoform X3 n=1 Tax=Argopecten irradians TaxID=31199 RepID=UPI003724870B